MNTLSFLYHTAPGRICLKLLTQRWVSRLCGAVLNSRISTCRIRSFAKNNNINLDEYLPIRYRSFNDFFTRKIRPERRPIEPAPDALISPCDAKLLVYPITEGTTFSIKESVYTVSELTGDPALAARFSGGLCLLFRLSVDDYHRYCYLDDGTQDAPVFLPGVLHTVMPIAQARYPIFTRNCREVSLLHTAHFGNVVQIEVGAMLVGKISNHGKTKFSRGEEKGMFEFGGSTIVLLLEPNRAELDPMILEASRIGLETVVRYGARIGTVKD